MPASVICGCICKAATSSAAAGPQCFRPRPSNFATGNASALSGQAALADGTQSLVVTFSSEMLRFRLTPCRAGWPGRVGGRGGRQGFQRRAVPADGQPTASVTSVYVEAQVLQALRCLEVPSPAFSTHQ